MNEESLNIKILEAIKLIASSTNSKIDYEVKNMSHKTSIFSKIAVNTTHINIILTTL